MSFSRERRRPRGFTLLEVLTAAAIGLVVLAAATAMFTGLRASTELGDRKLTAASDLTLGTVMLQRTVENAGYHLPAPNMAIAIHNNVVAGALTNGFGASALTVVARAAAGSTPYTTAQEGIVEGSDVLDVLSGTDLGNVVTVTTSTPAGGDKRTIAFAAPVGSDVLQYTDNDVGPVLLFRNSKAQCLGAITQRLAGLNRFEVSMINTRFELDATVPATCPAPNMEVYRLGHRTRFMVYQFPGETRPHLAVQREIVRPGFPSAAGLLGPEAQPTPLVEGIEDLQVSAALTRLNAADPMAPPLAGCDATKVVCFCNDGADDGAGVDCLLDQTAATSNAATLRGIRVELTSRGQLDRREAPIATDPTRGRLPASMDRPAPAVPDGVSRMQFRLAVDAPNLNPGLVAAGP